MRQVENLWEPFVSFENLYSAWRKAFRSTKNTESCQFAFELDRQLFALQTELIHGTWLPGPYKYFTIKEPKKRIISVAPFQDRIVHHALVNVLEPVWEPIFIYDSYATRKNKGAHAAAKRAQSFLCKNRWFLKIDIKKYFDSIDHSCLNKILACKIHTEPILKLCEHIISCGGNGIKGLPIGNLTSQFFANVYLNTFDHWIKDERRIKGYLRYMDDMVFFSKGKETLKKLLPEIQQFLANTLSLELKESATQINSATHGLSFLGLRVYPAFIRIRRENAIRSKRKLARCICNFETGRIDSETFDQSAQALLARFKYWRQNPHCDTL